MPSNESPCGQTIEKSLPTLIARPTLTPTPPEVGLVKLRAQKACGVPDDTVRSWICPSHLVGTQVECRFAYPADKPFTRNCSSSHRLDGGQDDMSNPFCLHQNRCAYAQQYRPLGLRTSRCSHYYFFCQRQNPACYTTRAVQLLNVIFKSQLGIRRTTSYTFHPSLQELLNDLHSSVVIIASIDEESKTLEHAGLLRSVSVLSRPLELRLQWWQTKQRRALC